MHQVVWVLPEWALSVLCAMACADAILLCAQVPVSNFFPAIVCAVFVLPGPEGFWWWFLWWIHVHLADN